MARVAKNKSYTIEKVNEKHVRIRDKKTGRFLTTKTAAVLEIKQVLGEVVPYTRDALYSFGSHFVREEIQSSMMVPFLTGNLMDSLAVGVYSEGYLLRSFHPKPVAQKPQHWGRSLVKDGEPTKGWGRNFSRLIPSNFSSIRDVGFYSSSQYGIVLFCGIPYGQQLEDGYHHFGWFSNLSDWFMGKAEEYVYRQCERVGYTIGRYNSMSTQFSIKNVLL